MTTRFRSINAIWVRQVLWLLIILYLPKTSLYGSDYTHFYEGAIVHYKIEVLGTKVSSDLSSYEFGCLVFYKAYVDGHFSIAEMLVPYVSNKSPNITIGSFTTIVSAYAFNHREQAKSEPKTFIALAIEDKWPGYLDLIITILKG